MTTKTLPATRRVWQYTATAGGIENHMQLNTLPMPTPKPDEHLVQVLAVALNPVDFKPAEAPLVGRLLVRKPATPGVDIVGRVVAPAAGSGVAAGSLVFGGASKAAFAAGGLAEYVATPTGFTTAVPAGVDGAEAAGLVVAGLTAMQTLAPHVRRGDRVLVNGGSGGVGVLAIQVAKALGCHVTATCSARNAALCAELGADAVIDYAAVSPDLPSALAARGEKFALVLDNVGSDETLYWRCHEFTLPDAKFVLVGRGAGLGAVWLTLKAQLWPRFLGGGRRKIIMFLAQPRREDLQQLVAWMQEGKLKVIIDSRFPFEQAPEAFRKLKTGRARGKIIVDVASADA